MKLEKHNAKGSFRNNMALLLAASFLTMILFSGCSKSTSRDSERDKGKSSASSVSASEGQTATGNEGQTPTGQVLPDGEKGVRGDLIMYLGQYFEYMHNGFVDVLPEGYDLVGTITSVSATKMPTKDFEAGSADLLKEGQEVYAPEFENFWIVFVKIDEGQYVRLTKNPDRRAEKT